MKKRMNTYMKHFRKPALICCGFLSCISAWTVQAEIPTKQTGSEEEVLAEQADPDTYILVEQADSGTYTLAKRADSGSYILAEQADSGSYVLVEQDSPGSYVLVTQNGSEEEITLSDESLSLLLSYSSEERKLLKELIQLRIRYGEDFTFAMKLPEDSLSDSSAGSGTSILRTPLNCRQLPGCPLPNQPPKTIQTLEQRITSLTETYSGSWSIYTKNLTTDESFVIQDVPMKSASVMKLFILGTVYEAIDQQELERTSELTDLMTNMICDSSNEASNRLLALLGEGSYADGIAKVNSYISRHGYSSQTHEFNGFENSATICDPDHFNQITARDCGKFLELVYRRELGSRRICNEIENLMLNQHTRYKIPAGLPEGVEAGNKTGEMDTVENDAAIVYGDYSDYILCVLSSDWDSKDEAISHIQEISSTVYDFFNDPAYYQDLSTDSFTLLAQLFAAEQYAAASDEAENDPEHNNASTEENKEYTIVSDETDAEDTEEAAAEVFSSGSVILSGSSSETEWSDPDGFPLNMASAFPMLGESYFDYTN